MPTIRIDPRDKPGLLIAAMRAFEGRGQVSFEGWFGDLGLEDLPEASHEETAALKRVTRAPQLDFVVLRLTAESIAAIWKALGGGKPSHDGLDIIHVQIAVDDCLVFGGYDNFHRDCVIATEQFPAELLVQLTANGVIRSYSIDVNE